MTAFLEYTVDGEVLTQEFTCLEDASADGCCKNSRFLG